MKLKILHFVISLVLMNFFFVIGLIIFSPYNSPITQQAPITLKTIQLVPSPTTAAQTSSVIPEVSAQSEIVPTEIPTDVPTQPPAAQTCIITVRGQQFDVQQFRAIHAGGDIFNCGTDMTDIFNGRHDDATFQKLQQYRVQ